MVSLFSESRIKMLGFCHLRTDFLLLCCTFLASFGLCLSESESNVTKDELISSLVKVRRLRCASTQNSHNAPDLILTGRLESSVQFDPHNGVRVDGQEENEVDGFSAHALYVRVKRVIRGERGLEGSVVVIGGWPCGPNTTKLRLRDSRIFLLEKEAGGGLFLSAIPLHITIQNLKKVTEIGNAAGRLEINIF